MDHSLIMLLTLFLVFALQHSFAISDLFKGWVIRLLGETFYQAYYRLIFTLVNLLVLAVCFRYIMQLPDRRIVSLAMETKVVLRILQCLGLWVFLQAGRQIDSLHFIGVRQVLWQIRGIGRQAHDRLIRDGIYGRVRHPLYLGSLLILWGEPHLLSTRNGLVVAILSTVYFLVGSMLEERRMVRQFGEAYRSYQIEVPRLVPIRWKKR